MELKKININGKDVEFVNTSRGNRSGLVHESVMFVDGCKMSESKCQYYNRTWESYCYQSAMQSAVHKLIKSTESYLKERFMQDHQYKKLTDARKSELEDFYSSNDDLKFYRAIYSAL